MGGMERKGKLFMVNNGEEIMENDPAFGEEGVLL
jgi:hypothetical protein